jgi:D-alanine-D-alanine ligase
MDKEFSKRLLAAEGVPQGAFDVLKAGDELDAEAVINKLGLPIFVKPARAGSSLGISKVNSGAELATAVEKAREVDEKVVFEAGFVNAREIEMGVVETLDGDLEITFPLEVLAKGEDGWFDFEAKYLDNPEPFNLHPDYPEGVAEQAQALARKVFRLLDCRDLARVDCFLGEDGVVYLNEVNTMPGMTPMSGVPQAFDAYGISYGELVERLVTLAEARARRS